MQSKLNIASNQNTTYALDVNFNNHGMNWGGGFAVICTSLLLKIAFSSWLLYFVPNF
jgi:hypothetical protein